MTVSELITELQGILETNGDLEVMTSSNYGDYHSTEQLSYIEDVIPCIPIETAYSHSGLAFPGDDYDCDDNSKMILALRYTSR